MGELLNSFGRSKLRRSQRSPAELIESVRLLFSVVVPTEVASPELRDVNDLPVLAAAVGGHADLIVTGDKDLLVLKSFQDIGIVRPVELLHTLGLD